MSTLRLSLAFAALLAILSPERIAFGQIVSGIENGKHMGPFIEPDSFQPDFQFFAPADVTNYETGRDVDPNRGFFFTYDRVYMNVRRPTTEFPIAPPSGDPNLGGDPNLSSRFSFVKESSSYWDGDFTWGNRLEMGFVDCDDRGWDIVAWHIDGPNEEDRITNGDRLAGPFSGAAGAAVGGVVAAGTGSIPDPANTGIYGTQDINLTTLNRTTAFEQVNDLPVRQTVNSARLSSIELNRILQRQYFHNGGVFEPLVGVRYIKFEDQFRYAFYQRSDFVDPIVDDTEIYRDLQSTYVNNMVGGQLGFRAFKETGHWKLSTEVRMFALQNFQNYRNVQDNYIWSADEPVFGRSPQYARQERFVTYDTQSEFVWGGDLKLEAAYKVTKYISLRSGFTFMDLGKGVGRGLTIHTNTQDVTLYGYTFGFDLNR